MSFSFKISAQSAKSRARTGVIHTPHGDIQTPAFVTVGTKATVKALAPEDLEKTKTQFIFSNTYHLVLSPGADLIQELGGIHKMSGIHKPFITDSGGFQVFSLAFPDRKNMYELAPQHDDQEAEFAKKPALVKITDDGVKFKSHSDGSEYFFTPEFSIETQQKIGADFMVAFDECIYNGATKSYTSNATERTHRWALRSLEQAQSTTSSNGPQRLYGVIQGGRFEDLRKESTEYIASLPFFGIALGGVSVGETNEELRQEVGWIMDTLHTDTRTRHLLGISTFDDVLYSVKQGIDTFDCILPTRDARTGRLYVRGPKDKDGIPSVQKINILRTEWKRNTSPICPAILGDVTFAYLHHLFKQRELLAYRLATIHNLSVTEAFFEDVRTAVTEGRL